MAKIILFARVSTVKQDLEQHKEVLRNEAFRLGYKESDVLYVVGKESGRSLDEDERITIQNMWELVETHQDIDCVVVFEVSRISRIPKVCFSVRDQLRDRHIQLILLEPYTVCFDKNWQISISANILFSVFVALAESNANLLIERTKRGKLAKAKEGKYIGGPVQYGYKVNDKGDFVVDEDKAEVVRLIFRLRNERNMSHWQIYQDLKQRGIEIGLSLVRRILVDITYTGQSRKNCDRNVVERTYPPIIPIKEYEKALAKSEQTKQIRERNKEHPRVTMRLLYCPYCGKMLHRKVNKTSSYYGCADHSLKTKDNPCPNTVTILSKPLDDLVWWVVKRVYKLSMLANNTKDIKKLKEEYRELEDKVKYAVGEVDKTSQRLSNAQSLFSMGDWSLDEYNAFRSQIKGIEKECTQQINSYRLRQKTIQEQLSILTDETVTKEQIDALLKSIDDMSDERKKNEIAIKYIKRITVEHYDNSHRDKKVVILFLNGDYQSYRLTYHSYRIHALEMKLEGKNIDCNNIEVNIQSKEIL